MRKIDLIEYLPDFLKDCIELSEIMNAENPELKATWDISKDIGDNAFIDSANTEGVERFEMMLGIPVDVALPLDIRKSRIKSRWWADLPYSIRMLHKKVLDLLGVNNFKIEIDGYKLTVYAYTKYSALTEELKVVLSEMVPANLLQSIVYENSIQFNIYFGGHLAFADEVKIRQVN